jgi:hypothetical protein
MKELDGETDVDLMMEFRQTYWDQWVEFCKERGYRPVYKG